MSSILKALQKLEQERAARRGGPPDISGEILKHRGTAGKPAPPLGPAGRNGRRCRCGGTCNLHPHGRVHRKKSRKSLHLGITCRFARHTGHCAPVRRRWRHDSHSAFPAAGRGDKGSPGGRRDSAPSGSPLPETDTPPDGAGSRQPPASSSWAGKSRSPATGTRQVTPSLPHCRRDRLATEQLPPPGSGERHLGQ